MTGKCHFDCDCWYSVDDETSRSIAPDDLTCDKCDWFGSKTRSEVGVLSLKSKEWEEQYDYMNEMGMDMLYVCGKKHYIKHRYSGRCKDWSLSKDYSKRVQLLIFHASSCASNGKSYTSKIMIHNDTEKELMQLLDLNESVRHVIISCACHRCGKVGSTYDTPS